MTYCHLKIIIIWPLKRTHIIYYLTILYVWWAQLVSLARISQPEIKLLASWTLIWKSLSQAHSGCWQNSVIWAVGWGPCFPAGYQPGASLSSLNLPELLIMLPRSIFKPTTSPWVPLLLWIFLICPSAASLVLLATESPVFGAHINRLDPPRWENPG